jgi:peptide/nickel transport system permease protein
LKPKIERPNNKIKPEQAPHKQTNWPLMVGLFLVAFIAFLAMVGPNLAPKDPAEENNIVMIDGEWYVPPFDLNTPGYPLGSDSFGRDLYSRILWGIRPTMIMVVVVAVVRLILGVIIGLSAGWFSGKISRFLDGLIQVSLALPVLLVALGAIALIGVEFGIWAFIIGLSLTGWVDTALQVREQTRIVKGQAYIEAASAMGAANHQILSNHILKQITPMLLMLFAFEISSTLMLTAGLGFLGYYIGGDVWVDTDDFVARRISGSPELGQMLATSWVTLTKPWAMLAVGTTIFITVLGFNLIGEGLRQSMGMTKVQRRNVISVYRHKVGAWIENYLWHPLVQFINLKSLRFGLIGIAAFFILTLGALLMLDAASNSDASTILAELGQEVSTPPITENSTDTGNPSKSSTSGEVIETISYNPNIAWEFIDESGFSSGLAISPDGGQLYTASQNGTAYALNLDGSVVWQTELGPGGVGTPVVKENGDILFADKSGGLSKLNSEGELVWHFQTEVGDRSHSGPAVGPDGTIYYTVGTSGKGYVQAVSPEGDGIWVTRTETNSFFQTPIPSLDEQYVFLKDDILSSESGEIIHLDSDLKILRFFSGDNGQNYLLSGHNIIQWEDNNGVIEIIDNAEWDSTQFSQLSVSQQVGVSEEGIATLLYTFPGGGTTMVWVSMDDNLIGISETRISSSNLIYIGEEMNAIVCGGGSFNPISTDCASMSPTLNEQLWRFHLGNYGPVTGGVMVEDRLYVATEEGYVFEINENLVEDSATTESELASPIDDPAAESGILWAYQVSEDIAYGPIIGDDNSVYILTEADKLHILNPDGQFHAIIQLESSPYYVPSESGRSAPLYIPPVVLPDGTTIVVSEDANIYAIDPEGNIRWEETYEGEPGIRPIQDGNGNLYFLNDKGVISVIDKDGIRWSFQSEAAPIPANGFGVGPDGNIYYVVTDYSKAFIQAVTSGGKELWVSRATTHERYDDLHISEDGKYVSLAENLFDAKNGELVEVNPENKVDEYFFGTDGRNYFRSLHSVYEWQLDSSEFVILNQGTVSDEDSSLRTPLSSAADANGIIWMFYPGGTFGGEVNIIWMTAEGELLGSHYLERNSQVFNSFDLDTSTFTECRGFEETRTLECSLYSPQFDEPLTQISIKEIDPFLYGFLKDNRVYLIDEDQNLTVINIGNLSLPSE